MYHAVHHSIGLDSIILNYTPLNCNKLHFLVMLCDNVLNRIALKKSISHNLMSSLTLFLHSMVCQATFLRVISGAAEPKVEPEAPVDAENHPLNESKSPNAQPGKEESNLQLNHETC